MLLCVDAFSTGSSLSDQVHQTPADIHAKGTSYSQMYWYRQLQGEGMKQIVLSPTYGKPEYEPNLKIEKFPVTKPDADSGTLTVKDLVAEDKGLYFCAVSQPHSDTVNL
uniref:Ig-like domain-containing protein n=1 Tax=Myripristis murdjan TaxID=586833 RepID=A0A667YA36_9TELE